MVQYDDSNFDWYNMINSTVAKNSRMLQNVLWCQWNLSIRAQCHIVVLMIIILMIIYQKSYFHCLRCLWTEILLIITRDSEVIMFSPCVFVCLSVCLSLSRCLSGRFNYEGLVPQKQYFAGTLLDMSSCASYVSRTHDVIDDVTRSQSR